MGVDYMRTTHTYLVLVWICNGHVTSSIVGTSANEKIRNIFHVFVFLKVARTLLEK